MAPTRFDTLPENIKDFVIFPFFAGHDLFSMKRVSQTDSKIINENEKHFLKISILKILDLSIKTIQIETDNIEIATKATTLVNIVREQAKIDIEGAKNTANQIERLYNKAEALRNIASEQAKTDIKGAKDTFNLAKATANQLQVARKAVALQEIAITQAKTDIEGAKDTANQIQKTYYKDMALLNIAIEQAKTDIEGAKATVNQIEMTALKARCKIKLIVQQKFTPQLLKNEIGLIEEMIRHPDPIERIEQMLALTAELRLISAA